MCHNCQQNSNSVTHSDLTNVNAVLHRHGYNLNTHTYNPRPLSVNPPDLWEISETKRKLPGTPGAKLSMSLGHNQARRSGQQYAPKITLSGAYGRQ